MLMDYLAFHLPLLLNNPSGKKVAELVNNTLTDVTYETIWNAHINPRGIYFVGIKTNSANLSKKMILFEK